jgi:hypothetical protein
LQTFDRWHKTNVGYLTFTVLELVVAYLVGSRALDTAAWWQYVLSLLLLIGALQNFVKLIGSLIHGKPKATKAR